MRLRLPTVLQVAVVGATFAAGVAACGDDDGPSADADVADAFVEHYFCVDNGRPDAGAGQPDANPCGQVVTDPADCPEGCEPVG